MVQQCSSECFVLVLHKTVYMCEDCADDHLNLSTIVELAAFIVTCLYVIVFTGYWLLWNHISVSVSVSDDT